jgi:hypothetical protein
VIENIAKSLWSARRHNSVSGGPVTFSQLGDRRQKTANHCLKRCIFATRARTLLTRRNACRPPSSSANLTLLAPDGASASGNRLELGPNDTRKILTRMHVTRETRRLNLYGSAAADHREPSRASLRFVSSSFHRDTNTTPFISGTALDPSVSRRRHPFSIDMIVFTTSGAHVRWPKKSQFTELSRDRQKPA